MRRMVHIAPRAAATDAHSPRRRIDVDVLDERKIDDQAIVADAQTACVVASASNRNSNIVLPAEMNGGNYVGHVSALGDQARLTVDHRVVDFARFFVARVGGLDQLSAELTFELSNGFLFHGFLRIRKISRIEYHSAMGGVLKAF